MAFTVAFIVLLAISIVSIVAVIIAFHNDSRHGCHLVDIIMDLVLTVILVVIMAIIMVGLGSRNAPLVVAYPNLPDQLYSLPGV
jgi:hypothetical protein